MREPTSQPGAPPPVRRRSRLRRFGRWVLYVALVLLAVHLTATAITGAMLSRELARLRARGEVLDISALAPKVPAGAKNAADVYQQAFNALRLSNDERSAIGDLVRTPPADAGMARQALAANARYFALIEEASRIPDCAFPVKWGGDPFDLMFSHLAKLREAANMLAARARLSEEEGRVDDAARDLLTTLRLEDHAQRDPIIVAPMAAAQIQRYVAKEVPRLLSAGDPSPDLLRQLRDQCAALSDADIWRPALRGERALNQAYFEQVHAGRAPHGLLTGSDEADPLLIRGLLAAYPTLGRPLFNLDQLASLRYYDQLIAAGEGSFTTRLDRANSICGKTGRLPMYRSVLTHTLAFTPGRAIVTLAARETTLDLTWYAARLRLYRYEHGRYPASLSDLAGPGEKLPADPFTDQPYPYRLEGKGFRMRSAGPAECSMRGPEESQGPRGNPGQCPSSDLALVYAVTR